MKLNAFLLPIFLIFCLAIETQASYPIDGYIFSGIRRLLHLNMVENDELKGRKLIKGAKKSIDSIKLHLVHNPRADSLRVIPEANKDFQNKLNKLFPYLHQSYAVSLLEISPDKPWRYASRKSDHQFQPGSVGKLAVITGFFRELRNIYPGCFEQRRKLLKNKSVRAGPWAIYDEHTIPIFDTLNKRLIKRQVRESDVFTLYEWVDHMMNVSNNGAASVVWREAMLMHVFNWQYPELTEEQAEEFFKNTPKAELADLAITVVNEPLRQLGIGHDEWRLGTFFTRGGSNIVPRKGGSTGTPKGLMKWMMAIERGDVIDEASSLEIKRLMYMTGRRIRYAASPELRETAVYFKSGSLYSCNRSLAPNCGKYRGNVKNYMNSVAIIERSDGTTYLIVLMSNVLSKNSAYDHLSLASRIEKMVLGV